MDVETTQAPPTSRQPVRIYVCLGLNCPGNWYSSLSPINHASRKVSLEGIFSTRQPKPPSLPSLMSTAVSSVDDEPHIFIASPPALSTTPQLLVLEWILSPQSTTTTSETFASHGAHGSEKGTIFHGLLSGPFAFEMERLSRKRQTRSNRLQYALR